MFCCLCPSEQQQHHQQQLVALQYQPPLVSDGHITNTDTERQPQKQLSFHSNTNKDVNFVAVDELTEDYPLHTHDADVCNRDLSAYNTIGRNLVKHSSSNTTLNTGGSSILNTGGSTVLSTGGSTAISTGTSEKTPAGYPNGGFLYTHDPGQIQTPKFNPDTGQ
jgi:hypothetical protein